MRIFRIAILCGLLMMVSSSNGQLSGNAAAVNQLLTRTINLGNALEAPTEGQWGLRLEAGFFAIIKKAGFTAVRLPAKFSGHAEASAPYKLEREFIQRVDWAIQNARKNGLTIILDLHNYDELIANPTEHKARFIGIWQQIAQRYKNQADDVVFELCNEPNGRLEPLWNAYMAEALSKVRISNPTRAVIVGPNGWNNAERLAELVLPDDQNLIVTFHNYAPFEFTHQGASWWADGDKHLGTTWTGTPDQQAVVNAILDKAVAYGKQTNHPIFMGEFGAYEKADMDSRAHWTKFTRQAAEQRGIAWGYWEFASGFGAYDRREEAWRKPLLDALISK